eukprot:TRINITY_DN516_c0_g1_i1.p1 TRINITY_DN516_c0_g1~~TRINITY_DN516_c0_g1_i1.p1  ORF type:complete len:491 (-),score=119.20 TRINITY_DN516_c0_g1_i1:183-1655(-)
MSEEAKGEFDFDFVVIGGGSGGIAAAREAAKLGAKTCLLDFVMPSPRGTTWGLGGTCVNVGCIPKKLFHRAAILGEDHEDALAFGWNLPEEKTHDWSKLTSAVQDHIGSLNWGYRTNLRDNNVTYFNSFAVFKDPHTVETTNRSGTTRTITGKYFLIACGGRPRFPGVPGDKEHCISSDDLFSLPTPPGKTLCVGASYISLECAGFLTALGYDTTVMVRSILLRGFDQQMAELVGEEMEKRGTRFIREAVPTSVEKTETGQLKVTFNHKGRVKERVWDTVLFAVGRDATTAPLHLEKAGVVSDPKTGKILCDEYDRTNVPHIFAVGDCRLGTPELTPVAIHAGKLLSGRLFGSRTTLMDYTTIPTTVFTPLEYGACGLSEEKAEELHGKENIEVYHTYYTPLEFSVPHRGTNSCYVKLVCNKQDNMRVLGYHVVGIQAGEITQGMALGMKLGATRADFEHVVGIHPTSAEEVTVLDHTKSSGVDAHKTGC